MAEIIRRPTPPDWHPGKDKCPLSCRGVWREATIPGEVRGWFWQCDRRECPVLLELANRDG